MRIYEVENYEELSKKAAAIISAQVTMKPNCVLGLATGSTPVGTYEKLAEQCTKKELDFSTVSTVNLDEYKGIAPDNEQSYHYFMNQNLFNKVNINTKNTHLPDGLAKDGDLESKHYEALIKKLGGIDLQLLGLGHNGHIGFNEPSDAFAGETHCVDLQESTIEANKRFFESAEDVPKQAYTMGNKTIMQARKILVLVSGEDKADIVKQVFFGPIKPQVPGSILQMHADVILIGDKAALSKINK